VHVLLRREGWEINAKKTYRIYKELGMQLRNKTPKRRVKAKLREDRKDAVGPNDVWAMDFVHDQLATGRKIRILTVVDTFSRYVPVLDARFSYKGENVVTTLDRVCRPEKLEAWRRDYNEERPHSAIGNKVPAALMKLPDASSPSV